MLDFIIQYWWVLILAVAVGAVAGHYVFIFFQKPTPQQLAQVKEWILYAVVEAEKELGSGTGQIKLRYVYDMFLVKFPFLAKIVPFELFSSLVDEVLDQFKDLLDDENVKHYTHPNE